MSERRNGSLWPQCGLERRISPTDRDMRCQELWRQTAIPPLSPDFAEVGLLDKPTSCRQVLGNGV